MTEPSGGMEDDGDAQQQASTSARPQRIIRHVPGSTRFRPASSDEMKNTTSGPSTEARSSNPCFSDPGNGVTMRFQFLAKQKQWKETYAVEGLDEEEVRREQRARDANIIMDGLAVVRDIGTPQLPGYVISQAIMNPSTASIIPNPSSSLADATSITTAQQAASTTPEDIILRLQSNGTALVSTSAHAVPRAKARRTLASKKNVNRQYSSSNPQRRGVGGGVPGQVSRPLQAVSSSHQDERNDVCNQVRDREIDKAILNVMKKTHTMVKSNVVLTKEKLEVLPHGAKLLYNNLRSAFIHHEADDWLNLSAILDGETTVKKANSENMQQYVNLNENDLDSALQGSSRPNQGLQSADDRSNTAMEDEESEY